MRYVYVLLMSSMLFACGKTGALYLPEEEQEAAPPSVEEPKPEADSSGKTD